MEFSVDFFKDEVRNGFYIPTAIKQAWAANLRVLSEVDRICEKYGITYFADWGSILGAVRHGGYVPWDDDLDICMKRKDYNRFKEVADSELPEGFAIHDFRRKKDHWLFLSRVVNCNRICFDEEHLREYHNFPYIAVVDIFVKDYLYRDIDKERERCKEIKKLIATADGIVGNRFKAEVVEYQLSEIEKDYKVKINRKLTPEEMGIIIYGIAEGQMARVPEQEADRIGQMFPMVLQGGTGIAKEYYDSIIRLPFENTTIPVPASYDRILRDRYGNYLEIHKVWTGHDYPYFEKQRENLQAVADFDIPEFSFDNNMLAEVDREQSREDSLAGLSEGFAAQVTQYTNNIISLLNEEKVDDVSELLPEVQQFVVDYATITEQVLGGVRENCQRVTAEVQDYCDRLYEVYLFLQNDPSVADMDTSEGLSGSAKKLCDVVKNSIINRKEILFLTIGSAEWKSFDEEYRRLAKSGEYDIFVVPLPVLFKDIYGRIEVTDDELANSINYDEYPEEILLDLWQDYDVKLHRPSVIYIQSPYDEENPCLTIPPVFYAKNLRKYTDKLIYMSPFTVSEFGADDYNDVYNMKHYVTAPGVIYSDVVYVQSDNMKHMYVDKLTSFAGEDTRGLWNERIKVCIKNDRDKEDIENDSKTVNKDRKKIMYCIGLNEVAEYGDRICELVRKRMEIFKDNKESIDVDIVLYPGDKDIWNEFDEKHSSEIMELITGYAKEDWCEIADIDHGKYDQQVLKYDAYYGSASPLVPVFSQSKKPVMIASYEV